jgi:rod shape-determining protein MreC
MSTAGAGHLPPPIFRKGPAPFAKMVFFVSISLALMVVDLRHHTLDRARAAFATVLWPLRQMGLTPITAAHTAGDWFAEQSALQSELGQLRERLAQVSARQQRLESIEQENADLRALMNMRSTQAEGSIAADITYAMRDVFSRRVVVNQGSLGGVVVGAPVVDSRGLVGQVTRVYPQYAEVTLLTDPNMELSVESQRNGLRALLGGASGGTLELRFQAQNTDIESGDIFVTSGLDGIYPQGLLVARVTANDRQSSSFARITAEPIAGVERGHQVLLLAARPGPYTGFAQELPAKPTPARQNKPKSEKSE